MDEYISKKTIIDALEEENERQPFQPTSIYSCVIPFIRKLPAADVQPVKHGKWIDAYTWTMFHEFKSSGRGEHFWCSECEQGQKHKSNYCPCCGARMDLKDGDAE